MDFFGAQEDARRNTWRLAALFTAAVLCLVLLTNLLIVLVYGWASNYIRPGELDLTAVTTNLPAAWWAWISAGVVGVVALASGYKYLQVKGGRSVAESMGATLIPQSTANFRERRLLNVVEEMALASGVPVPPVYLVEEPSINAFAAGFSPDDAVIGVNRGTLDHLSRDELQGVIAHEFSHILNGDSRINLRLIAALHGILFIGLVGRAILYGMGRSRHRRRRSGGGAPALVLGLGMLVIGYTGIFFGNLIKAAVSRQREYLADAASVQFTRNPGGIAGALKKIGGLSAGSRMSTASAKEVSHIFFGQAQRFFLNRLTSTHPPLEARIRAVDPAWDGVFPAVTAEAAAAVPETPDTAPAFAAATTTGTAGGGARGQALEVHATPDDVVRAIGRVDQSSVDQAAGMLDGLPAALKEAAHDPFAARALLYALVLDTPAADRARQLEHLRDHAEQGIPRELERLQVLTESLNHAQRLTLLEMAIPALKELSEPQYRTFTGNLVTLIKADRRIDLLEWVLHRLLIKELRPHFQGGERRPARHRRINAVAGEAAVLLSALAREGGRSAAEAADAFAAGMAALELQGEIDTAEDPDYQRLNRALTELRDVAPLRKPRLIKACAATVLADGHVSAREGTFLRGVAAALDCPLPPSIYRTSRA